MPESRKRKKPEIKNKEGYKPPVPEEEKPPSPSWWAPVLSGLLVSGVIWIVITYLSKFVYPIPALYGVAGGNGNLLVGFGLLLAGFFMTLRWR